MYYDSMSETLTEDVSLPEIFFSNIELSDWPKIHYQTS